MSKPAVASFAPNSTYVHLPPGTELKAVPVGPEFWPEIMSGQRKYAGRLLTLFEMSEDWKTWEMHPHGDELLFLTSGEMDIILELDGSEKAIALEEGLALTVPKGIWHIARVAAPSKLLAITAGEGTEVRPVSS